MRYSQLIHRAWEITLESTKLKWFAFVPAFVGVIVFMAEITWQLSLFSEEFGLIKGESLWGAFEVAFLFLISHELLWWIAPLVLFFILVFAFILPAWVRATLILSVRQRISEPEKYLSIRQKMIEGFGHFFEMFQLFAALSPLAFVTILIFTATMYRFYHASFFGLMFPLILIYMVFALCVNFFCAFAPYYVVCEKQNFKQSLKKSFGLVFLHLGRTMSIILLMILVNVRIIVNVIAVLGVPIAIVALVSYFTTSFWVNIAIFLAIILGIGILWLAAYLSAIVDVFSTAVWTLAFYAFRREQENLASKDDAIPEDIEPVFHNTSHTPPPEDTPLSET